MTVPSAEVVTVVREWIVRVVVTGDWRVFASASARKNLATLNWRVCVTEFG
jgi:hypothetical protein